MIVLREIIQNQREIDIATVAAQRVLVENDGQPAVMQKPLSIPEPIYERFSWGFKLRDLNNYYIEDKEQTGERIVIANISYEGLVRIISDTKLENMLSMYLQLQA